MIELHKDKTAAVHHEDIEQAVVPTTATCKLYDAAGGLVQSAVVTLPTVSTTTAAGTTASALTLASATGVVVGHAYRLDYYGQVYVVRVVKVSGSVVTLSATLPEAPPDGSTFRALRMSATLTAVGSVKPNMQLRFEFDDGSTYRQHQEVADAVRWPFEDVVSARDVAEALSQYGATKSDRYCEDVAAAVNARIKAHLRATNRRPDLVADPTAFEIAGRSGIDWSLAERNVLPLGDDPVEMRMRLRDAFRADMALVIEGLTFYDGDDDGKLDEDAKAPIGVVRIRR